jgi:outer membrane protein assembly factor BamE (lipoprotein component of BamABCDE complex)
MKQTCLFLVILCTGIAAGCGECAFVTEQAQCDAAVRNAPRLPQVKVGMTAEEVRAIMKHDPERREADTSGETWYYMSDYGAELMSAVKFENNRVVSIKPAPWRGNS